jgi:DNA polymerase III alpha subunit (gram-positive type)
MLKIVTKLVSQYISKNLTNFFKTVFGAPWEFTHPQTMKELVIERRLEFVTRQAENGKFLVNLGSMESYKRKDPNKKTYRGIKPVRKEPSELRGQKAVKEKKKEVGIFKALNKFKKFGKSSKKPSTFSHMQRPNKHRTTLSFLEIQNKKKTAEKKLESEMEREIAKIKKEAKSKKRKKEEKKRKEEEKKRKKEEKKRRKEEKKKLKEEKKRREKERKESLANGNRLLDEEESKSPILSKTPIFAKPQTSEPLIGEGKIEKLDIRFSILLISSNISSNSFSSSFGSFDKYLLSLLFFNFLVSFFFGDILISNFGFCDTSFF